MDFWISYISCIFDFNSESGLRYIQEMDYINKIVNRLDYKNANTREKIEEIQNHAVEYIESRLENNSILGKA